MTNTINIIQANNCANLLTACKMLKDAADSLQDLQEDDTNSAHAKEIYEFLGLDFYEYYETDKLTLTDFNFKQ